MQQTEALEILKTGSNVFITGAAGSGKTHLLNQYIEYLQRHGVGIGITASTGIAATHMGGQTIHSWSGLGIKDNVNEEFLESLKEKPYLRKRFDKASVLIIDEISMLHHYRLDLVDKIARTMKNRDFPFGGMQVILCGDFFQLPPVAKSDEPEAQFAYKAKIWQDLDLKICYLSEQYRQNDQGYLKILNAIRDNEVTEDTIASLMSRHTQKTISEPEGTKLYTHNVDVDAENERELKKLPGEVFEYQMADHGREGLVNNLKKGCLAPEFLRLKINARIMLVKNNFDEHYANGTIATVVACNEDGIVIKDMTGRIINIIPASWTIQEEGKILAEIVQYPIRLAWAITVHKSQGMSLDRAEIDLTRSFEKGMGYVALSRLRSLNGLTLKGINNVAMMVDEEVLEYDADMQEESRKNTIFLHNISSKDLAKSQQEFIERISTNGVTKKSKPDTIAETKRLLDEGETLAKIAIERNLTLGTIIGHLEKLKEQGPKLDLSNYIIEISPKRLEVIIAALEKSDHGAGEYHLSPAKSLLGKDYTYEEIRLARLYMNDK